MLKSCPRWIPSVIICGVIFWFTLAPNPTADLSLPLFAGADKVAHAVMFGFLTLVLWFDSCRSRSDFNPGRKKALLSAALAFAIGCLVEWLQKAMELGRSFEWADILADGIGALLMLLFLLIVCRRTN